MKMMMMEEEERRCTTSPSLCPTANVETHPFVARLTTYMCLNQLKVSQNEQWNIPLNKKKISYTNNSCGPSVPLLRRDKHNITIKKL